MNYKLKRGLKRSIQKARESRNLFMKLGRERMYRDRLKVVRHRARFFQDLLHELSKILAAEEKGNKTKITSSEYRTSFYNEQLMNTSLSQKHFYNLIREGDAKCLDLIYSLLNRRKLSAALEKIIQQSFDTLSSYAHLDKVRFIPNSPPPRNTIVTS